MFRVLLYYPKLNSLCNTHICRIKQPNHELLDPEDEGTAIIRNIRTFSETRGRKICSPKHQKKTDNPLNGFIFKTRIKPTYRNDQHHHTCSVCYDSGCRQRVAACGADRGTQTQTHVGTNRIPALAYHVCQPLQPSLLTTHTAVPHNTNTITLFTQRHLYQTNVVTVLVKHRHQKPAVALKLNSARTNDVTPANAFNISNFAPISGYIRLKFYNVTHDFNIACFLDTAHTTTKCTTHSAIAMIYPSRITAACSASRIQPTSC